MLLLLFSQNASDPTAPVYSSNYGTLCLETTIFADELEASVLIGELSASATMGELSTAIHETTLSSIYSC